MLSIFTQFIFGTSKSASNRSSKVISRDGTDKAQDEAGQASFKTSSSSSSNVIKSSWWKDKSLCFDLRAQHVEPNRGEQLIGCFYPIEDFKGNPDEFGLLEVTNLRLVWICPSKKRVNFSIGWRTVSLVYEQNLKDAFGEPTTSLFVLTKYESTKFEFVFKKPAQLYPNHQSGWLRESIQPLLDMKYKSGVQVGHLSPTYLDDPFDVVFKVWQAYKQTHLFRHCRSNIPHLLMGLRHDELEQGERESQKVARQIRMEEINLLQSEQIIEFYRDITYAESRSSKHLGTLVLTNVRIIWIDSTMSVRNLSIPYIRVNSIKIKQNEKLLVSTHDYLGSLRQADFRTQNSAALSADENCRKIYDQAMELWCFSRAEPRFGPESCEDSIQCASHLQPIEHLLATEDGCNGSETNPKLDSYTPVLARQRFDESVVVNQNKLVDLSGDGDEQGSSGDELNNHKMSNYLGQQPTKENIHLVCSNELGLAVERPKDQGLKLRQIWLIDV